jgi:hypothetical protein
MSVALSAARQEVSKRAQEFLMGTATGGSASTVVDANNLFHVDGYWDETWVYATSGTNNGLTRRVQTFTSSTNTLTLYSAFTGAVPSGMTYELYRRFSPSDVTTSINRAINVGAPDFREKVRAVATATMNTLTYAFPTGPMMLDKGLVGIEYQWYTDATQTDWPYQKVSTDLYEVLESWDSVTSTSKKTLQLKFNPETNKLIRFVFDGPLGNVTNDTDIIHLDLPELEWLYQQATAELWRTEVSRTSDASRKSALEELARHETRADQLRRQLAKELPPRALRRSSFRVMPGRTVGWW